MTRTARLSLTILDFLFSVKSTNFNNQKRFFELRSPDHVVGKKH